MINKYFIRTEIGQTDVNVEFHSGKPECGIFINIEADTTENAEYSTFLPDNNSKEYSETKNIDLIIKLFHNDIKKVTAKINKPGEVFVFFSE